MAANIKFVYLYRDANNHKSWGSIVFRNPGQVDCQKLSQRIRGAMMVDQTFIAEQLGVPDLFLFRPGFATDADHCFHEFFAIEETAESPNDAQDRSIKQLVAQVARVARHGWKGFDIQRADSHRFRVLF